MIHALPGMGADQRMFPHPWDEIPGLKAHDWVRYSGEKSVAEMAHSMCAACGIEDGDVLVGASLGGMVACEISRIREIRGMFLVGSAVHPREIQPWFETLHPLAQVAPIEWLRFSARAIPLEFTQMFSKMEASFIRAMCKAVFEWNGLGESHVPLWRIHGSLDAVIRAPDKADMLIGGGGHLISITHAKLCAEFVQARVPIGSGRGAPD